MPFAIDMAHGGRQGNYKHRIKKKLDLHSAQELARYAFEFAANRL